MIKSFLNLRTFIVIIFLGSILLILHICRSSAAESLINKTWVLESMGEIEGNRPLKLSCRNMNDVLLHFYKNGTFTINESCTNRTWEGSYTAEKTLGSDMVNLTFSPNDFLISNNLTAIGAHGTRYSADGSRQDSLVFDMGSIPVTFLETRP